MTASIAGVLVAKCNVISATKLAMIGARTRASMVMKPILN